MSELFADLGLMPELTRAVTDTGYAQPTPVQVQAVPVILEGCDVLAGAQTGTGKTAAFALPLLQRLLENPPEPGTCPVRALIVTPTRELAAQIEESVQAYGKYVPLRSTVIFGGVGMGPQVDALKAGVDILVATPGRLLDHANEQTVDLSQVEILVLDEADRMLDMGFIHDVKRILALLPAQRQNLLFSATFSDDIRALADGLLHSPVLIEVSRRNAESELVAQRVHPTGQDRKRALLVHLIKSGDWKQVLVFTRTKHGANRLAHQLGRSGIAATAIHGNKGQGARTKALADFKAGLVRVLVATDLAARGLDIEELPHVVNFDLPQVAEDYVHRIGRTGRAGSSGEAVSLVSPEEQPLLAEIEKLLGRSLDQTLIAGYEPGSTPPPQQQRQPQPGAQNQQPRREQQPQPQESGEGQAQPQAAQQSGDPQPPREGRGRRRGRGRNRGNGVNGVNGSVGTNSNNASNDAQPDGALPALVSDTPQEKNFHRGEAPAQNGQRNNQQGGQQGGQNRSNANNQRNQSHAQRQEALREERDNRGNRDTTKRPQRNVILDDDFGNRIPPVKLNRSVRARIAAGDIDDELDNIGNRMPPPPKHLRHLDDDAEEINFNIAPPPPPPISDDDEGQQPQSNAGQMFPSSAGFMGEQRTRRGNGSNRGKGGYGGNGSNRGGHRGRAEASGNNGNGASGNSGNNGNAGRRGRSNKNRRRGQPQPGAGQGQGQGQRQGQPRQRQGQNQGQGQGQGQRHRGNGSGGGNVGNGGGGGNGGNSRGGRQQNRQRGTPT